MEEAVRDERRFYYKTPESAKGAWRSRWRRALTRDQALMEESERAKAGPYYGLGMDLSDLYWEASLERPRPLEVEKRYSFFLRAGLNLVGVVDQVRPLTLKQAAHLRPDLVVRGRLAKGHAPVMLVDLKSGFWGYDPNTRKEEGQEATQGEWIRTQFQLHEYYQPTIYTRLYEKVTGKRPVAFGWWHLRTGQVFYTYRGEEDYQALDEAIEHVVGNLNSQSFPKNPGFACRRCDFLEACRARAFLVSYPGALGTVHADLEELASGVEERNPKQARLKGLVVPRARQEPPPEPEQGDPEVVLVGGEPWDEEA
jgi:hypothetical protein